MHLDQYLQDYLRTGHWRGAIRDNPIVLEKGLTYVRHNGLRIGNAQDAEGGVLVFYLWNLNPVGWDRIIGAKLDTGRHFIEQTAEGRTLISNPQAGDPK
ncbi:MAG: hypothetical protein V4639_03335 [Pseudomonadota bacterium]